MEELALVLASIREGITLSDASGHFIIFNPEMERLTGYTMEEANSGDFTLMIYPDEETRLKAYSGLNRISEIGDSVENEATIRSKDGTEKDILVSTTFLHYRGKNMYLSAYRDITERNRAAKERTRLLEQLQEAMANIKTLKGLLSVCAWCGRIRNEEGNWEKFERYVARHSEVDFTHGMCDDCFKKIMQEEKHHQIE